MDFIHKYIPDNIKLLVISNNSNQYLSLLQSKNITYEIVELLRADQEISLLNKDFNMALLDNFYNQKTTLNRLNIIFEKICKALVLPGKILITHPKNSKRALLSLKNFLQSHDINIERIITYPNNFQIMGQKISFSPKTYSLINNSTPTNIPIEQPITSLKTAELLAIILSKNKDASEYNNILKTTNIILKEYGSRSLSQEKSYQKLVETLNINIEYAKKIVACFEIGRRFFLEKNYRSILIRGSEDVYNICNNMKNLLKENFRGLYLDSRNYIIHDEIISIGHLTASLVHPREVFFPAIENSAAGVIVIHNHPSGDPTPSTSDNKITKNLVEAGKILNIPILDHIIIGKNEYYSYNDHNKILKKGNKKND